MSIAKVIEITARSDKSFEDAIRTGLVKAGESVHGIREAWVAQQKVMVEGNKVVGFQVELKLTFVVD
ncbi:MAG TPA: dodecin domain-containing protein [Actinobacteria bacterium]|nr:dodecin domain-containing protein [Actinomycetota bacterium]